MIENKMKNYIKSVFFLFLLTVLSLFFYQCDKDLNKNKNAYKYHKSSKLDIPINVDNIMIVGQSCEINIVGVENTKNIIGTIEYFYNSDSKKNNPNIKSINIKKLFSTKIKGNLLIWEIYEIKNISEQKCNLNIKIPNIVNVDVSLQRGSCIINNTKNEIQAKINYGDIIIENNQKRVFANTLNGDITLNNVSKQIYAKTNLGNINAIIDDNKPSLCTLETYKGDLDIKFKKDLSALLIMKIFKSEIDVSNYEYLKNKLFNPIKSDKLIEKKIKINNAIGKIKLICYNGIITLKSL